MEDKINQGKKAASMVEVGFIDSFTHLKAHLESLKNQSSRHQINLRSALEEILQSQKAKISPADRHPLYCQEQEILEAQLTAFLDLTGTYFTQLNKNIEYFEQNSLKDFANQYKEDVSHLKKSLDEAIMESNQKQSQIRELASKIEFLEEKHQNDLKELQESIKLQAYVQEEQKQDESEESIQRKSLIQEIDRLNDRLNSEIFKHSKFMKDVYNQSYLSSILGERNLQTTLLYRASLHGWKKSDFHSKCDKKGATISLMQIENGPCIGGFTQAQWQYQYPASYFIDSNSFLFNLTDQRKFECRVPQNAILVNANHGPCFGLQELDVGVKDKEEMLNSIQNCQSKTDRAAYQIPCDQLGRNMLTNKIDEQFTITEIEVWGVTIIESIWS